MSSGRAVVTGGAGFVGSHVCDRLLADGWEVICLDSLLTGDSGNLSAALTSGRLEFRRTDVTRELRVEGRVDRIYHFASPASPRDYLDHPIATLKVGALGTLNGLGLAKAKNARFFLASTSEVYGDPKIHPQPESYWGNVNPIGPRSVYDEAKRYAEAVTMAYHRAHGVQVRIARIFNTYGPRMRLNDGRAVPAFMTQALRGDPITVHGNGLQTRSLCYVDDLVNGIQRLVDSDLIGPVNLGATHEVTILELAELVRSIAGSRSAIVLTDRPIDDPEVRCPDTTLAKTRLGWLPRVSLAEGLARTMSSMTDRLSGSDMAAANLVTNQER
jgi:dTDP-glucose 4,6-dehydratase